MDLGIHGNAAVVTASSSGLGRASAASLLREGVNVVINGRDGDRLSAAREALSAVGDGRVVAVQADITDPDASGELVDAAIQEFGRLDHLVTSAGGPAPGPFLETSDEEWYDAYDLLVMSVVRLVREAAPHLRDAEGSLVTITSRSVKEAIDRLVLSNSVRMSVIGLEKTLSTELAPEVRANAVLPGSHETARIEDLIESQVAEGDVESYEDGVRQRGASIPVGRMGKPEELGDTVAFLLSERASFINGAAVPVDGGETASNL
jgi:NAD(P)-dependent dehydrogenase (short-subunit alcohol dehydrogenase family)